MNKLSKMEIKNRLLLHFQNFDKKLETILHKKNLTIDAIYSDLNRLRELIYKKYSEANPEHLVKSQITDEFFEQKGIKYLIKYLKIDKTKNKPILINQKNFVDPFEPPINQDVLVDDNFLDLGEHRLIFTKFPLFKEQVLLVSREFKSQYEHLSFENFRDAIILIDIIDGCAFFNGGEKSGASQPRKHLQAFPYKSLPNKDKNFGIFKYMNNVDNLHEINFGIELNNIATLGKFYQFEIFNEENVEHIFFKFSKKMVELMKDNEKANITGEICLRLYDIMAEYLDLFNYDEEGKRVNKIVRDFSFIITQEFMFMVKRHEHDIFLNEQAKRKNDFINLNTLAFFFIIVSRSQSQIEELKNGDIIKDVYTKL